MHDPLLQQLKKYKKITNYTNHIHLENIRYLIYFPSQYLCALKYILSIDAERLFNLQLKVSIAN